MSASTPALALAAAPVARPRDLNPWIVALAVVIPTFMEVLDTTIANVALRYIAGGLSAAETDSEWVITSYLAANAIILPISGWLAARFGRRRYFLASIAIFTLSSALCGLSTSLPELIFFRVLQGLAGGGLQPSSQAILLDAFPAEKQGGAQTFFGVAALLAPVLGPTLGGWLTDQYSWRWIFYINAPIGVLAFLYCHAVVHDPEYLVRERVDQARNRKPFDTLGLTLLSVTLVCWEVTLSKGQEWDWFGDPFYRVQTLSFGFAAGLISLIVWETRHSSPIVNFRPMLERNFALCCLIIFCAFGVLYGSSTLLPSMLESLFGYDAFHAGLVLSPAGIFTVIAIIVVGVLLGRGFDARWLIGTGLLIVAAGNYWMSQTNLNIAPQQVIWPRVVMVAGLGLVFAPLNVAAYLYTPLALRGAAVGLLSLLRNEGGSVGTSVGQTILERRDQFHDLRLDSYLDGLNPAVNTYFSDTEPAYLQLTGDATAAHQMALQSLANLREQQASSLAYYDCFLIFAVLGAALAFLVLLMKPSSVQKGRPISHE